MSHTHLIMYRSSPVAAFRRADEAGPDGGAVAAKVPPRRANGITPEGVHLSADTPCRSR
jgi:hypothetical protein